MPPVSPITLIIDILSLAWAAYQFVQGKIEEIEYQARVIKLQQTVQLMKAAKTPKEKQAVNEKVIRDVIDPLR